MRERYGLYNLETDRVSEATWATYKGAMKRCGPKEVVVLVEPSNDVIDWLRRHPEWAAERLRALEQPR